VKPFLSFSITNSEQQAAIQEKSYRNIEGQHLAQSLTALTGGESFPPQGESFPPQAASSSPGEQERQEDTT